MTPHSILRPRFGGRTASRLVADVFASQLARFLVVGAFNTAAGYVFFLVSLRILRDPVPALALSTVTGVLFNFVTTGGLVFRSVAPGPLWRFALAYGVTFVFNATLLRTFMGLGLSAPIAGLLGIPGSAALSFVLSRRFVFARPR